MSDYRQPHYPTVGGYSSSSNAGARGAPSMSYPQIAQPIGGDSRPLAPPPMASGGGPVGVKVVIRAAYRVAPPVQLAPLPADVPPSVVQLDFDLERNILTGLEMKQTQTAATPTTTSPPRTDDANSLNQKFRAMGLGGEALSMALATYGDVQDKVLAFCPGYNMLREMGFPPEAVAGALASHGNDPERALAMLAP